MTLRYTRYLSLLAWVAALFSPLLIAPAVAQTDYDSEDNGYIDITTLAQLNAMRWDLNGDGSLDTLTTASDTMAYQAAFPNAATGMGCPNTGCNGYELKADLDFDNDNSGTVDSSDDYPNWAPIGPFNVNLPSNGAYTGTFKGNNNTISNLTISNNSTSRVGLFGGVAGTITGVGLQDANVTHAVTSGTTLTIRTGAQATSTERFGQAGSPAPSVPHRHANTTMSAVWLDLSYLVERSRRVGRTSTLPYRQVVWRRMSADW